MEAVVSLDDDRLVSHRVLPADVQPAIHGDEFVLAGAVVLDDPRWVEALARRGISDPSLVHVEAWTAGQFEERGRRLVRAIAWLGRSDAVGQPVRAAPLRPRRARRSERDGGRADRRPRARRAGADGERGLPRRRRPSVPHRSRADRDHAARRRRASRSTASTSRWQKWALRVGFFRARVSCCTTSRYDDAGERRRSATARRSPSS